MITQLIRKMLKNIFATAVHSAMRMKTRALPLQGENLKKGKIFTLYGETQASLSALQKLKEIDYIKFIDGRPWLILYAWIYRIIYNFKNRKEFTLNAVNSLDDENTHALAQKELELLRRLVYNEISCYNFSCRFGNIDCCVHFLVLNMKANGKCPLCALKNIYPD